MRLRKDFPFRRLALVLAGGGAFGAYEVGVLRTLHAMGMRPDIIAGASVGALNALGWVAHDGDPAALERTWRHLRTSDVGMRWGVLALRAAGSFLFVFGLIEALLLLAGLPEFAALEQLARAPGRGGYVALSGVLELLAWVVVACLGVAVSRLSGPIDDWMSRRVGGEADHTVDTILGWSVIVGGTLYIALAMFAVPWPLGFHRVVIVSLAAAWAVRRPGPVRRWLSPGWLRLMPETGGRGLWRNAARREVIRRLVRSGNPARLIMDAPLLMLNACDLATGRITYFTNRKADVPDLEARLAEVQCDLLVLDDVRELVDAAVASSAVPVLFTPERLRGHHYIDGGLFANQPLAAVTAAGADAILLVLVAPSEGPRPVSPRSNLVEIAGRLTELANWRDLHAELRHLPEAFRTEGGPAPVCVVEPPRPLEGTLFDFQAERSIQFMDQGEADARRALEQAGWLEAGESATPKRERHAAPAARPRARSR